MTPATRANPYGGVHRCHRWHWSVWRKLPSEQLLNADHSCSFLQLNQQASILDMDIFDAVSEAFPEALAAAELLDEVDILQIAQPGVG